MKQARQLAAVYLGPSKDLLKFQISENWQRLVMQSKLKIVFTFFSFWSVCSSLIPWLAPKVSTRGQQLFQTQVLKTNFPQQLLSPLFNMSTCCLLGTKAGNSFLQPQSPLMLSLTIKGTVEWSLARISKEPGSKDTHENETAHRDLAPVF